MEHKILSISFVLTAIAILSLSLFNPLKVRGYYPNDIKREISIDKKIPEEIENINDNPTCNNNNDDFGLYKKYL